MPTLTLDTVKIDTGRFELIQTESAGYWNKGETVMEIDAPDRMIAAMTNMGLACKWFSERESDEHRIIILQMDSANPDEMNGAEHNDLFKVINELRGSRYTQDVNDFIQARLKYQAMYGKYIAYLDKILFYLEQWRIKVKLEDYKQYESNS